MTVSTKLRFTGHSTATGARRAGHRTKQSMRSSQDRCEVAHLARRIYTDGKQKPWRAVGGLGTIPK